MPTLRCLTATMVFLGVAVGAADAADAERKVTFPKGATATTLTGKISGRDGVNHLIETGAGQTLQLIFAPSNRSCSINVFEPGTAATVHNGSAAGNEFAVAATKAGAYRVQVYLMRSAARRQHSCRYRLSIELTGAAGGISPGVSDSIKQDLCKSEAAAMYGVEPRRIAVGAVRSLPGGSAIDATADKQAEGSKKLRCLFKPDGRFDHIMAMTPDGE